MHEQNTMWVNAEPHAICLKLHMILINISSPNYSNALTSFTYSVQTHKTSGIHDKTNQVLFGSTMETRIHQSQILNCEFPILLKTILSDKTLEHSCKACWVGVLYVSHFTINNMHTSTFVYLFHFLENNIILC